MEQNNISLKQKLGNAFSNIKFMMQSDRRILVGVIGLGMLVVLFVIVTFFSLSRKQESTLVTTQTPSSSTAPSARKNITAKQKIQATLSLVLVDPKKVIKVNDLITFTIVGDSGGQQVRGYDAAFKFDPSIVSFVSEKNLYPSFDYQRRLRGNWVIVTSTQPLSSAKKAVFSKVPFMGITFKALKSGVAYFPMSYIPDSYNDSNLIDTASNDMLSSATGIVVQIVP